MVGATGLAAFGVLPWLSIPLSFSDGTVFAAGPFVQIALTALSVLLVAYMPANWRVLALENSHRAFDMRMEDVANAYWAAHEADRSGVFKLKSEFDAVKERMMFLRDHPDLGHLEPDILESAAKMSRISEDLAERYSDDAVARVLGNVILYDGKPRTRHLLTNVDIHVDPGGEKLRRAGHRGI